MSKAIALPFTRPAEVEKKPIVAGWPAQVVTDLDAAEGLERIISELQRLRAVIAVGLDTDINPENDEMEDEE